MAQPCLICLDALKAERAAELIGAGLSDAKVAAQLGGVSRAGVQRHRQNHIIRPAQDRLVVITKGAAVREERQQLAQAAAAGTPAPKAVVDALLGYQAQAEKLAAIEARLERMAEAAEAGKSANSVAQLSAQQLRSVEVRAKLAGVGGYAPVRATADGGGAVFSVTINIGQEKVLISTPHTPEPDALIPTWIDTP